MRDFSPKITITNDPGEMKITPLLSPEEAYFEQFSGEDEPEYHWTISDYESVLLDIAKWKQMYEYQWEPVTRFIVAPNHYTFEKYCRKQGLGPNQVYRIDRVKKLGGLQNKEIEILVTSYPYPQDQKIVLEALDQATATHKLRLTWIRV